MSFSQRQNLHLEAAELTEVAGDEVTWDTKIRQCLHNSNK